MLTKSFDKTEISVDKLAKFFDAIEPFGWGTKTTNHKSIKKQIMDKFTWEQIEELGDIKSSLHNKLYNVLFDEVEGVGDDGFDDLIEHIIGLGREEYEKVLKHPDLAQKRVNSGQYKESFAYCFPYKEDYEKLNKEYYLNFAKQVQEEYQQASSALPSCEGQYRLLDTSMGTFMIMFGSETIGPFTSEQLKMVQKYLLAWEEKSIAAAKLICKEYRAQLERLRVDTFVMNGSDPNVTPTFVENFFHRLKDLLTGEI
jgi:hypothetical protein